MTDKEQLARIMELCVEISTETKADVFIEFHGHDNSCDFSIYKNGWYLGDKDYKSFKIRLPGYNKTPSCKIEEFYEYLVNLKAELEGE